MSQHDQKLHDILPPLIFGTATFNNQYNKDVYAMDTTGLVATALDRGIRAFDTSPYYGPAEELLGAGLESVRAQYPREAYRLMTKVGRIGPSEFDFSPARVRTSIARSLQRLHTTTLDVVFCHDVEFADTTDSVVAAVRELRRLRDESGCVRFVGVSGYPVPVLCEVAEAVVRETGEPLDAVMSYAHFTLQNQTLWSVGLPRLRAAGVDCVLNASVLGMGLLRDEGVPVGKKGDWHPAPEGLRAAVHDAAKLCGENGEKLEDVAIRWALESWMERGKETGSYSQAIERKVWHEHGPHHTMRTKMGISVMGVSQHDELEETIRICRGILDREDVLKPQGDIGQNNQEWNLERSQKVHDLAEKARATLGKWADYSWQSPPPGFVNERRQ
jgi:aryl-alcohol dehydrogenase-like predicted oxidoreductase